MIQGKRHKRASTAGEERLPRRPIDMFHLGEQALGDSSLELEILRRFDEIVAVHTARLRPAVAKPDLLHHLHTLKAASAGVGAWALAEHARLMEGEIARGDPKDPERIADVEMAVAEVRAFIAGQIALDERRAAEG